MSDEPPKEVTPEELAQLTKDLKEKQSALEKAYKNFMDVKEEVDTLSASIKDGASAIQKDQQAANAFLTQTQTAADSVSQILSKAQASEKNMGELKGKVDSDVETIAQAKARFDDLKKKSDEVSAQLTSRQTELQTQIGDIQAKISTLQTLEQTLVKLRDASQVAKDGSEQVFSKIQQQEQSFQAGINQTSLKQKELDGQQADLQQKIGDISDKHKVISELYSQLLEDPAGDDDEVAKSLKTQFSEMHVELEKTLTAIKEEQKKQVETFKKMEVDLRNQIEQLLPGAGAAGLASSYYNAKLRYSPTNDMGTTKDGKGRQGLPWYKFLIQFLSLMVNYALFIAPLVIIYSKFSGMSPDDFKELSAALIYKMTLTIPMFVISGFGLASILSNRRLYEEYNYKQRAMELYHSFKTEIETTKDESLKANLLNLMIDVVKDKPTARNEKQDTGVVDSVQELLSSFAKKLNLGKAD